MAAKNDIICDKTEGKKRLYVRLKDETIKLFKKI